MAFSKCPNFRCCCAKSAFAQNLATLIEILREPGSIDRLVLASRCRHEADRQWAFLFGLDLSGSPTRVNHFARSSSKEAGDGA